MVMRLPSTSKFRTDFNSEQSLAGVNQVIWSPAESFPSLDLACGNPPTPTILNSKDKSIEITAAISETENYCLMFTGAGSVDNCHMECIIQYEGTVNYATYVLAKGIDINNFVGVTSYNNKIMLYERVNGNWNNLGIEISNSGTIGKKLEMDIEGDQVTLTVDGNVIGTATTGIKGPAYLGILLREHPTTGLLFTDFKANGRRVGQEIQVVPCDRSGWNITESSAFSDAYKGWRAFNCTALSGSDCWVSEPDDPLPQWIQLSPDIPEDEQRFFVPTRIVMKARVGVPNSHMNDRRPDPLVIEGSNDGHVWHEIKRYTGTDPWNAGQQKSFVMSTLTGYKYFKINWESNGSNDPADGAQMGWIKLYGYTINDSKDVSVPYNLQGNLILHPEEITLTWECNDHNVDEYWVHRDGVKVAEIPVGTYTYKDTGLTPSSKYEYFVTGYNNLGYESDPSEVILLKTKPMPAKATVNASKCYRYISVSFDCTDLNVAKYELFKDDVKIQEYTPDGSGTYYYKDEGVPFDTDFTYHVESIGQDGEKTISDDAIGKACDIPPEEILGNWEFLCDGECWNEVNASADYSGTAVKVTRLGSGAKVAQTVNIPSGEYLIKTKLNETTSSGFVQLGSSYPLDYLDAGTYEQLVNLAAQEVSIGVGTNNPDNSYCIFEYLSFQKLGNYQIPCMTSENTPYGIVSSNSEYSEPYGPEFGLNCDKDDCWVSEEFDIANVPDDGIERGAYIEWKLTDEDLNNGRQLFYMNSLEYKPRDRMPSDALLLTNPEKLVLYGIKTDDTLEEVYRNDAISEWANNNPRTWTFTSNKRYKGFRLYITKVRKEDTDGIYNTGASYVKVSGKIPTEI
jgi:hypothetical protein